MGNSLPGNYRGNFQKNSKPSACCTAPPAVLDGGGSTSGFGDDYELLVRASAVLKSHRARKLAPWETRPENALVLSLSITRTFASRCLSSKANEPCTLLLTLLRALVCGRRLASLQFNEFGLGFF